jgi:hypothetical protein
MKRNDVTPGVRGSQKSQSQLDKVSPVFSINSARESQMRKKSDAALMRVLSHAKKVDW